MDKRIAIGMMVVLLLLVVTAAYAPNTGMGTGQEKAVTDQPTTGDEETVQAKMLQKLDTIVENQQQILEEIKALKAGQEKMQKDVKYIRSKSH